MELDIFDTKLSHDVLGVEFCTGFTDQSGRAVKGFYCHRDDLLFCCGDAQSKYCCNRSERLAQQLNQLELSGLTSVLNTRAVSMITLISASVLTFIITIALTAFTISTCQRMFAKKFRSNCTPGICSESGCNGTDLGAGTDLCQSLSASLVPTSLPALSTGTGLLVHSPSSNVNTSNHSALSGVHPLNNLGGNGALSASATLNSLNNMSNNMSNNMPNNMSNNMTNVNSLSDPANYAGPISNCSSTSTDQCTVDTNSTMITTLSDASNGTCTVAGPTSFGSFTAYSFSPNLNQTNFQSSLTSANNPTQSGCPPTQQPPPPASSLNRLTNALASITSMLTSGGSQRNATGSSNNPLFHISGSDQLTDMIISQPPPPAYEQSFPTSELPRTDLPEGYPLQLSSPYYNNELCT